MATPPLAAHSARNQELADALARDPEYTLYPCSDGKRMADDQWQSQAMLAALGDLEAVYPDALVAMDLFVYPERGNNENRIAPDVFVALGNGVHNRLTYLAWREGKPPDWVLEMASMGATWRHLMEKRRAYAAMGVPEYWLFDPQARLFPPGEPQLQGLKLSGQCYQPLPAHIVNGERVIRSEVLKLDLRVDGDLIRFHDPATGRDILHHAEAEALLQEIERARAETERANAEIARAKAEIVRRRAAEARIAEMEATIKRLQSS